MKMRGWILVAMVVGTLVAVRALAAGAAPAPAPATAPATFKEVPWDDLVPKGWDPTKRFRESKLGILSDSDPRMLQMMREMRETWDNAPTNSELDGAAVKLPGYVIPLEEARGELKEFLLVPYFGACIHTPPPPANQIIHVIAVKPAKGFRMMDAVWVSGTLKTLRRDSVMGTSGYQMQALVIERYVPPTRP